MYTVYSKSPLSLKCLPVQYLKQYSMLFCYEVQASVKILSLQQPREKAVTESRD